MLDPGSYDAERFVRSGSCVLKNQVDKLLDLCRRALLLPRHRRRYEDLGDCPRSTRPWESHQTVTIDMVVRKSDERLVLASVVPLERPRIKERPHNVEHTFEALGRCWRLTRVLL